MGGFSGPGYETMKEIDFEVDHGQKIADAGIDLATNILQGRWSDTVHKDGSKSSVCALCTGNVVKGAGYPVPDDGHGNQVTSAANFFDQLTGHPYAIKNYDTEFMRNKEYENWIVIENKEDIKPGDVILFKGSGYDEMMEGNPTSSNPSGYHLGVSTSTYYQPWSFAQGMTGGISLVDDRGASPIWHRNKGHTGMTNDFLKAARYVGPEGK